jgi:hypothetical protein
MTVRREVLLRTRNDGGKSFIENQNTMFKVNNFFFFQNPALYEIMGIKYGGPGQATVYSAIRRMRFACWIHKATDIRSEYVILIPFTQ